MYTPHTVTLYNLFVQSDPETLEETTETYITVLRGVFLDQSKGTNVRTSGLEGADSANLYIPLSVSAVDGQSGQPKRFVSEVEFIMAEDKSDIWTLGVGRNTHFIKGEVVVPETSVSLIEMTHDHVYVVTKVDLKDYGSPSMQHWEVGGV